MFTDVRGYSRSPKVRAYSRRMPVFADGITYSPNQGTLNDGVNYIPHPLADGVNVREDVLDVLSDSELLYHLADCGFSESEINFLAARRKERKEKPRKERRQAKKAGKAEAKVANRKAKADKKQARADKKRASGEAKKLRGQAKVDKANSGNKASAQDIIGSVTGGLTAVVDSAGQVVQAWKGTDPSDPSMQVDPAMVQPGANVQSSTPGTIKIMGQEITTTQAAIAAVIVVGGVYFLTKKK